ncbi:MAG: penicillin-binding protein activator, partial [Gallionellaceae bacterium]
PEQISSETPASESSPPDLTILHDQQLLAIEAFLAKDRVEEGQLILSSLDFTSLTIEQQTRYTLAQAKAALIKGDGQKALYWLGSEFANLYDGLPLENLINISMMRSEAYEFSGKPLAAARERIFLAPVLDSKTTKFNHEQIWFDLQLVPKEQLEALATKESSPDLTGWIELTLIGLTKGDDLLKLLTAINDWKSQHLGHPAALQLPNSLQMLSELALKQPKHLAVLLPLTGPLAKAGKAIRNGIMVDWYRSNRLGLEPPDLSFYDTAVTEDIKNLYKQAVLNGAETVLGPLSKTKVQQLSKLDNLSVPVLALNYADTQSTQLHNFFQFGLAPEDEAEQIANDIWQQGARRVMVIAPNSTWGKRVSDAFISVWQLQGGTIASKA